MRWVLLLLALLPAMAGIGGAATPIDVVDGMPGVRTFDGADGVAFLPAGARLLPVGWSDGSGPAPRTHSRAPHPLADTGVPAGWPTDPGPRARERSAAHRALSARHALDRAGRRAFLLGTPPPLRSV